MGKSREKFITAKDGQVVFLRVWDNVQDAKAVVQIFHGMAEHSGRYEDFASFLNERGIIVYADDHRGHGRTADEHGQLGYLGENGFYEIVEDEFMITNEIKKLYKNLPIFIFAHSFGSFIGQEYIIRHSNEVDGIILSGTAKNDGRDVSVGFLVAGIQSSILNDKKPAKFIDNFAFGGFNKNIKEPKTKVAWLTRDEDEQRKYLEDKYCNFVPSINFYKNLFLGLSNLYNEERLNDINTDLPILIVAGKEDPVGKEGESVTRLYEQYKKLNINNVELRFFKDCRHEILNELNKEEIFEFLYSWIKNIESLVMI